MVRDACVAIADPIRREILDLLNDRGTTAAGEIASELSHVSRSAVSSHLRVLRECQLIAASNQGKTQKCSLNPAPMNDLRSWPKGFSGRQVNSLKALREIIQRNP